MVITNKIEAVIILVFLLLLYFHFICIHVEL